MHSVCLVTGGARSGKSRYALQRAMSYKHRAFVATARPVDDEMRERIERHRRERSGSFVTIEEPQDPARAFGSLPAGTEVVLLDCLTVWLGNLMHCRAPGFPECAEVRRFLDSIRNPPCDLIVVTNETGMGIVPENAMARAFRDAAGFVNREVAASANEVVLMVCGLPLFLKGGAAP